MRISERILSVVLFGVGLGLATAYAFDGTRSPSDIAPAFWVDTLPVPAPGAATGLTRSLSPPAANPLVSGTFLPQSLGTAAVPPPGPLSSFQAFQSGTKALRAGDTKTGLNALEYAATNGHPIAAWKLGRMYAEGEGVDRNDLRAYQYFRAVADAHADDLPGTPEARFVSNAFVALGTYYLDGIPNSDVKADPERAREMYYYAASYFGDADAQYHLGRLYLDGTIVGMHEPKQAVRWLLVAARKGQHQAQAVLGAMLFKGEEVPRQASRGLMWLTLARDSASSRESWITDLYSAAVKQATEDERAVALVYLERWLKTRRD
jgi:uncharacterized protein